MTTSDTNRKLPMKVKILFPLAQNAPTIQTVLQMYFLAYFHTNVLGIGAGVFSDLVNRENLGFSGRPIDRCTCREDKI